jgi:hypothetical protein
MSFAVARQLNGEPELPALSITPSHKSVVGQPLTLLADAIILLSMPWCRTVGDRDRQNFSLEVSVLQTPQKVGGDPAFLATSERLTCPLRQRIRQTGSLSCFIRYGITADDMHTARWARCLSYDAAQRQP